MRYKGNLKRLEIKMINIKTKEEIDKMRKAEQSYQSPSRSFEQH